MTGFGPPSNPPHGSPAAPAGSGLALPTMLAYAAGVLGILDFVWGFLDWIGGGGEAVSGYVYSGGAAVGLGLAAGLWAAARTLEKNASEPTFGPVALAVSALLVVVGNLVGQPTGADTKIGMILALITSVLQVGVLGYAWLLAAGKIAAPQPKPQGPPPGPQQGYGPPQGYGNPGQVGPQGYGAPQGYGPPPGQPQAAPRPPQQGGPSGGGFGPPSSYGSPQGGPSGPPQGPPPGQNPPPPHLGQNPPPPHPGQNPPPPPSGNPYSPPGGQQH